MLKCARGISGVWDFRLFMNGGGGRMGEQDHEEAGGAGAKSEARRTAPCPPAPQPAGRTCRWSSVWGWVGGQEVPS